MSVVLLLALKPHWLTERFFSEMDVPSLLSLTVDSTLPAMVCWTTERLLEQSDFSSYIIKKNDNTIIVISSQTNNGVHQFSKGERLFTI